MSSLLRRIIRHPLRMGGHGHSHGGEARLFGEPVSSFWGQNCER
jgi:hypothetical protein